MLTQAQVEEYWDVGGIVVPDVLTPAEVVELRQVTDELVTGARKLTAHTDVYDLEDTHTPEHPRIRRIKRPEKVHATYANLVRHPRILEALRKLWGPDIRFQHAKLNMKAAGYGAAVEWHQDWAFYPHTNEDLAAVGVMMDDMGIANGPLMIVPGSHRGPILDHHENGAFVGAVDPKKAGIDLSKAKPLVGTAGSITIHHVRTLHGSALNTSDRDRRLLLLQFRAADAWPLLKEEQFDHIDDFNALMVCGRPREPRMADLPIVIPKYPRTYQPGSGIYAVQNAIENRYFDVAESPKRPLSQPAM